MSRASRHQAFFFKDMSVMGEISYRPTEKWNLFGKVTYDVNKTNNNADMCVLPGTELKMVGGGIEFTPLVNRNHLLRFHANLFYSWGKNAYPDNVKLNKTVLLDFGITRKLNVLKWR